MELMATCAIMSDIKQKEIFKLYKELSGVNPIWLNVDVETKRLIYFKNMLDLKYGINALIKPEVLYKGKYISNILNTKFWIIDLNKNKNWGCFTFKKFECVLFEQFDIYSKNTKTKNKYKIMEALGINTLKYSYNEEISYNRILYQIAQVIQIETTIILYDQVEIYIYILYIIYYIMEYNKFQLLKMIMSNTTSGENRNVFIDNKEARKIGAELYKLGGESLMHTVVNELNVKLVNHDNYYSLYATDINGLGYCWAGLGTWQA